jgi:hypothetical protein
MCWAAALDGAIDRETVELFRSKEMISRKERTAQTREEMGLVDEEKKRQQRHQGELRRLLRQAILSGSVFFRGNDRSPTGTTDDVKRAVESVLARTLPEVYNRFSEAAAKVSAADLNALLTSANLHGLPPLFSDLRLLRTEGGQPVLVTETGPLAEVLARIENKHTYGEAASGKFLEETFGREPYGWSFDAVRLFVVALLRAGKLVATSQGTLIESALSVEAKSALANNVRFRQASFQPKVGIDHAQLLFADEYCEAVFGRQVPELEQSVVARTIRAEVERTEGAVREAYDLLLRQGLPGSELLQTALDQARVIQTATEDQAILTFNGAHRELKEAIARANDVIHSLDEPHLHDLRRARRALDSLWPFLQTEPEVDRAYQDHAAQLTDLMAHETFFRELPAIDQHTRELEQEYGRRRDQATSLRANVYAEALERLRATPGWEQVRPEEQVRVAEPLATYTTGNVPESTSIPELRADAEACSHRLGNAIRELATLLDGDRVEVLDAAAYFSGGIETEEQLDEALKGLRERCLELIASGKKILVGQGSL